MDYKGMNTYKRIRQCPMCGEVGAKDEFERGIDKERAVRNRERMRSQHKYLMDAWLGEWSRWWGREPRWRKEHPRGVPSPTPPEYGPFRSCFGHRWIVDELRPNTVRRKCQNCGHARTELAMDEGDWK